MKTTILKPIIKLTAGIFMLVNCSTIAQTIVSTHIKLVKHINNETVIEEKEVAFFNEAEFKHVTASYNSDFNMTVSYTHVPNNDWLVRHIVINDNSDAVNTSTINSNAEVQSVDDQTGTKTISMTVNSENDNLAVTQAVLLTKNGDAPVSKKTIIIQDDVVANYTLNLPDLSIYPNPTADNVNLNFSILDKGNTYVTVTDLNGTEVYHEELADFTGNYQNLVTLPNNDGIYSCSIVHNGKALNKKIIKKQ